ncbi:hypothetical protein KDA_20510 [Dictyobacter alpinus]|uniref:Uncharacterized protein n=1 Tax=Dictyobacter alpinus TaxID=2014873 RepID=A0A402B5E9_9CHLR|nr:hypothetical protein KDA_20510 [Dictyobacter alpinus]
MYKPASGRSLLRSLHCERVFKGHLLRVLVAGTSPAVTAVVVGTSPAGTMGGEGATGVVLVAPVSLGWLFEQALGGLLELGEPEG